MEESISEAVKNLEITKKLVLTKEKELLELQKKKFIKLKNRTNSSSLNQNYVVFLTFFSLIHPNRNIIVKIRQIPPVIR